MPDILTTFTSLTPSPSAGQTTFNCLAARISDASRNYIAKSEHGYPILLIETCLPIAAYPTALKLENLSVSHGYSGTINTPEGQVAGVFSIVECRVAEAELIGSFLRLASHLLASLSELPEPRPVAIEIRKLVQIFQALRQPPVKSIQGLWAELFVIINSPDLAGWSDAWHDDPMERYDFSMHRVRVEVKSAGNRTRRHHFSHEQLHPPNDVNLWIASIFVERSTSGTDCLTLLGQIQNRLSGNAIFKIESKVIKTLGLDYAKASGLKFDNELARSSLSFIPVESVPRIPDELPDAISEVRYSVLISQSSNWQVDYPAL